VTTTASMPSNKLTKKCGRDRRNHNRMCRSPPGRSVLQVCAGRRLLIRGQISTPASWAKGIFAELVLVRERVSSPVRPTSAAAAAPDPVTLACRAPVRADGSLTGGGTVYPRLNRLRDAGLVTSRRVHNDRTQPRC